MEYSIVRSVTQDTSHSLGADLKKIVCNNHSFAAFTNGRLKLDEDGDAEDGKKFSNEISTNCILLKVGKGFNSSSKARA